MFALLTVNFNRVTIAELQISALLITLLIGLYPFFAPIQPLFGRLTDRFPLSGYRRSPYLLIGMLGASLTFPPLPGLALALSRGETWAIGALLVLMVIFGLGIALIANTFLDLVSDVAPDEKARGQIFAVSWTAQTLSIVVSAMVVQHLMPTYSFETMQPLYTATPLVALLTTLPALIGLEQRLQAGSTKPAIREAEGLGETLRAAWHVLNTNSQARAFFGFIVLALIGVFLQDAVLEVMGGSVFGLTPGESSTFQQVWTGGVLISMVLTGIATTKLGLAREKRILIGSLGTAAGLGLLAFAALEARRELIFPALWMMGLFNGIFTMSAVTLMSDMTVAGATGRYLGLWSMAQAFATGLSFIISGVLHTLLIESGRLNAQAGFAWIFGIEAIFMLASIVLLRMVSVERFRAAASGDTGIVGQPVTVGSSQ
jgi:BCD family chlorophyll transporter-like MFS transporter